MSFNPVDLKKYCDNFILKNAALEKQVIVLCEGYNEDLKQLINDPPLKIGNYFEQHQDASFYQRSIPKWCRDKNIVFYICGRQSDVIDAYFYLKQQYQAINDKRLDINKLFALIDIDLQSKPLPDNEDYPFKSLEAIYKDLYLNGQVNQATAHKHKIWVTGLLHKEAYWIIPEVATLFKTHQPTPMFNNQPLDKLEGLYHKILASLSNEKEELRIHFTHVKERIGHCPNLYKCASISDFQEIWLQQFSNPEISLEEKQTLIYALLTLAKSKPIWDKIKFSIELESKSASAKLKKYRDELSFTIASEFYAKQLQENQNHLTQFFHTLVTI